MTEEERSIWGCGREFSVKINSKERGKEKEKKEKKKKMIINQEIIISSILCCGKRRDRLTNILSF